MSPVRKTNQNRPERVIQDTLLAILNAFPRSPLFLFAVNILTPPFTSKRQRWYSLWRCTYIQQSLYPDVLRSLSFVSASSGLQRSSSMTGCVVTDWVAGMFLVVSATSSKMAQSSTRFSHMVTWAATVLDRVPDFVIIPTSSLEFHQVCFLASSTLRFTLRVGQGSEHPYHDTGLLLLRAWIRFNSRTDIIWAFVLDVC